MRNGESDFESRGFTDAYQADYISVQCVAEANMANLFSERLRIEPIRSAHAQRVFSSLQNPAIYIYLPEDPPKAEALQKRYDFLEKGTSPDGEELWLNWVAFLRDSMTPVGTFQATLPKGKKGAFAYIVFPSFLKTTLA